MLRRSSPLNSVATPATAMRDASLSLQPRNNCGTDIPPSVHVRAVPVGVAGGEGQQVRGSLGGVARWRSPLLKTPAPALPAQLDTFDWHCSMRFHAPDDHAWGRGSDGRIVGGRSRQRRG
jgi:hypothetical protein